MAICVLKVLWCIFGRFSCVIFFGMSIATYDIASSRSFFEVAYDTIDCVLATIGSVQSYSFLFVKSIIVLVVVVIAISFRGCIAR